MVVHLLLILMRFVIVTGMSGGGKKTALRMLEDVGFYCVDNLPVELIEKFVELLAAPGGEVTKVALGVDVRANQGFEKVPDILSKLKKAGYPLEILYMEANDETLLKRYKESRRMHPLSPDGRIEEGIRREREILGKIKGQADYVMDSSKLLTRDLKIELDKIFVEDEGYNNLISWNGREPKYDIRDWSPEHEKMGKGVTLSKDELEALRELYPFSHRTSYFRVLWTYTEGY